MRQGVTLASTTFLKLDGIDGEATDRTHLGEIEVLSWGWGFSGQTVSSGSGGTSIGKVTPREFQFVHRYDKASPALAREAIAGRHVANAVLSARKSGAGQKDFLKVTMNDVLITSIADGDDGSGPTEHVSMVCAEMAVSYQPPPPGSAQVGYNWNIAAG
jgi:type VI secretion system secreted protein Hcp